MILSFLVPAGKNERFAPGAGDSLPGTDFTFKVPGRDDTTGRILKAEVIADGFSMRVQVEVPDFNIGEYYETPGM